MSPANVLEPTYDALRRRLLTGLWSSGYRIEAGRLAGELGVSMTPVRDALYRLTGERLVQSMPGDGFHVPVLVESEFRALLDWHHKLLTMALRAHRGPFPATEVPQGRDGIGERTALLFGAIASTAGNVELDWALNNAAARLGPFRRHEDQALPGVDEELCLFEELVRGAPRPAMNRAIDHYHQRRSGHAANLTRLARDGASAK